MKRNQFISLTILILSMIIFSVGVSAIATIDVTEDPVRLGVIGSDVNEIANGFFTITTDNSTGAINITTSNVASTYKIQFSDDNINFKNVGEVLQITDIVANGTKKIYFKGFIPTNMDLGIDVDIGEITIIGTGINNSPVTITNFLVNAKASATLKKVILTSLEYDEGTIVDEGEIYRKIKPMEEIKIGIIFENFNSYKNDIDLEDIDVEVTIKDIKNGRDISEDDSINRITPESQDKVAIYLTIPEIANAGSYDVEIVADARDSEGGRYDWTFNFEIEIDRKSHKIEVRELSLLKENLACNEASILNVEVANIGYNEEDDTVIEVVSDALGINHKEEVTDELTTDYADSDSKYSFSLPIQIDENTPVGTHDIKVTTFFSGDQISDNEIIRLTVDECKVVEEPIVDEPVVVEDPVEEDTETNTDSQDVDAQAGEETTEDNTAETNVEETTEKSESFFTKFSNLQKTSYYLIGLIILVMIMSAVGAYLIVNLIAPKEE